MADNDNEKTFEIKMINPLPALGGFFRARGKQLKNARLRLSRDEEGNISYTKKKNMTEEAYEHRADVRELRCHMIIEELYECSHARRIELEMKLSRLENAE